MRACHLVLHGLLIDVVMAFRPPHALWWPRMQALLTLVFGRLSGQPPGPGIVRAWARRSYHTGFVVCAVCTYQEAGALCTMAGLTERLLVSDYSDAVQGRSCKQPTTPRCSSQKAPLTLPTWFWPREGRTSGWPSGTKRSRAPGLLGPSCSGAPLPLCAVVGDICLATGLAVKMGVCRA